MRAVALISGRGSNLKALLDAGLPVHFERVISNRPGAAGLELARARGVATAVIDQRDFTARADFDAALAAEIDAARPDLILLAGYLRLLNGALVECYLNRILNIHPALLPAFPGLHTHARALTEGVTVHGCTVHFVRTEVDRGPIIIQAAVPVRPDDSEDTLAERVLEQEHRIYPQAVRWFAEGRLEVDGNRVRVRGEKGVAGGALVVPGL